MSNDPMAVQRNLLLIRNSPEFQPFRDWLLDQQIKVGEDLISSNDDRQLHLAQGAARWLRKFSDLLDGSQGVLDKRAR